MRNPADVPRSDASLPKCCARDVSLESWNFLKARLKELGVDQSGPVWRSKVDCLREYWLVPSASGRL